MHQAVAWVHPTSASTMEISVTQQSAVVAPSSPPVVQEGEAEFAKTFVDSSSWNRLMANESRS